MTRIFDIFSHEGNKLINPRTGTKVITTGNHGDKTHRFQFEAFVLDNKGQKIGEPKWFLKVSFDEIKED